MKNCEPLVLGPLLAIARRPGWLKVRSGLNSSLKLYPGSPVPLPAGSPHWIMKFGMTRWQIVPSYSGVCIIWPVLGFFHGLVPSASPMKLATVSGALSGNKVQVMLPSVVSMMAVVPFGAGAAACAPASEVRLRQRIAITRLRIQSPGFQDEANFRSDYSS